MKRFLTIIILLMTTSLLLTACWEDDVLPPVEQPDNEGEQGDPVEGTPTISLTQDNTVHAFTYNGIEALKAKPVKVHYIIPTAGDMKSMPILFVFPGEDRSAAGHLSLFTDWAKKQKVMVFAFEYATDYFPSTTEYILGGINTKQSAVGVMTKDQWNFQYVEAVFNEIRLFTQTTRSSYDMWGHSAGAQFVHRYCTFVEDAHIHRAIAANSGWYTLADADVSFPYGYKEITDVDWSTQLPRVFSRSFILQLGGNDTDSSGLNTNAGSVAQGATRLARGQYYFDTSKALAAKQKMPFNWTLQIVPDVGHDALGMAKAAQSVLVY